MQQMWWRYVAEPHTISVDVMKYSQKAKILSKVNWMGFQGLQDTYKYPQSIAKLNLSYQVKSHERSTFWKNMTRNIGKKYG